MEMAVETAMLTASFGFNDTAVDTDTDQLSTGRSNRRGKWGDLWYVEQN